MQSDLQIVSETDLTTFRCTSCGQLHDLVRTRTRRTQVIGNHHAPRDAELVLRRYAEGYYASA